MAIAKSSRKSLGQTLEQRMAQARRGNRSPLPRVLIVLLFLGVIGGTLVLFDPLSNPLQKGKDEKTIDSELSQGPGLVDTLDEEAERTVLTIEDSGQWIIPEESGAEASAEVERDMSLSESEVASSGDERLSEFPMDTGFNTAGADTTASEPVSAAAEPTAEQIVEAPAEIDTPPLVDQEPTALDPEVETPPAPLRSYRNEIEETQDLLTRLDYKPGPVDGWWGARTRRAMQQFQRDRGLQVTSRPDDTTLLALRVAVSRQ